MISKFHFVYLLSSLVCITITTGIRDFPAETPFINNNDNQVTNENQVSSALPGFVVTLPGPLFSSNPQEPIQSSGFLPIIGGIPTFGGGSGGSFGGGIPTFGGGSGRSFGGGSGGSFGGGISNIGETPIFGGGIPGIP